MTGKKPVALLALFGILMTTRAEAEELPRTSPDQVVAELMEGNKRYAQGVISHFHQETERRTAVAHGQKPSVAVLSCSDSRVPPEIVFDHGIGDLFVVRLAGHVMDTAALASLEYAVEHLGVSVILVLGHERCGAVTAAVKGGHLSGHLAGIVEQIAPAVTRTGGDVERCIAEHAVLVAKQLAAAKPVMSEFVSNGKIRVIAGKYDLDTGVVQLLSF